MLDVQHLKGFVWRQAGNLLAVSLGKALNGIASNFEWLDW